LGGGGDRTDGVGVERVERRGEKKRKRRHLIGRTQQTTRGGEVLNATVRGTTKLEKALTERSLGNDY